MNFKLIVLVGDVGVVRQVRNLRRHGIWERCWLCGGERGRGVVRGHLRRLRHGGYGEDAEGE